MQKFELPLIGADIDAEQALKIAIDAKRSGVVRKTDEGTLQLVHYKQLSGAVRLNRSIDDLAYTPLLNIEGDRELPDQVVAIRSAGLRFGYRGSSGHSAKLVSIRETFAKSFLAVSQGSRCTRPNKQAGVSDHDWYHYYPPQRRAAQNPSICKICGSPIK